MAPDIYNSTEINSTPNNVRSTHIVDINFPQKSVGFIALDSTNIEFIGPDNRAVQLNDLDQCMIVDKVIRDKGGPSYRGVISPSADFNIKAWEYHLREYPD